MSYSLADCWLDLLLFEILDNLWAVLRQLALLGGAALRGIGGEVKTQTEAEKSAEYYQSFHFLTFLYFVSFEPLLS